MTTSEILWWSNHGPLKIHENLLKQMYGDEIKITVVNRRMTSESVEAEFFSKEYRDLYVAGPLSVLEHVATLGIEPLIENRIRVHRNNAHYSDQHAHWKVLGFKRLKSIVRETEPAVAKP